MIIKPFKTLIFCKAIIVLVKLYSILKEVTALSETFDIFADNLESIAPGKKPFWFPYIRCPLYWFKCYYYCFLNFQIISDLQISQSYFISSSWVIPGESYYEEVRFYPLRDKPISLYEGKPINEALRNFWLICF